MSYEDDVDAQELKEIEAGKRVETFFSDEHVVEAVARVKARYLDEWKAGETPEAREAAWFKTRALDDLTSEFERVVDSAKRATISQERKKPNRR